MKKCTKSWITLLVWSGLFICSCTNEKQEFIRENTIFACKQTSLMLEEAGKPNGNNYPRTMGKQGELLTTNMYDWTPGFFPGTLWYLYELTGDTCWRAQAEEWTHSLEALKTFTGHHDLGFMMYCSYGNAYRLAPKEEYKDILIESAQSLCSRFNPVTQTIKSWNYRKAWDGQTEWFYPVIADNMMNLEMLFAAYRLSGRQEFYDVAVRHADATIKNHLREDFSSYHVVDYDTITGAVKAQATCQGYSDNSTWSRGQAWLIYGFTMMYRETKDRRYLDVAEKTADYYLANLPEDLVPYWDFNVGQEGYAPGPFSKAFHYREKHRDASAAAIVCSALFELAGHTGKEHYNQKAVAMLHSLASPAYRAEEGQNACFILEHSVGSIPHDSEIDKPLVYADYYFLEALLRYKRNTTLP